MLRAYKEFWKRYADFNGKSTRSEYWYAFLCNGLIGLVLTIIFVVLVLSIGFSLPEDDAEVSGVPLMLFFVLIFFSLLLTAYVIATIVPSFAILARRLRDAGLPWALLFLNFVPFGAIALIVLCCQPTVNDQETKKDSSET